MILKKRTIYVLLTALLFLLFLLRFYVLSENREEERAKAVFVKERYHAEKGIRAIC